MSDPSQTVSLLSTAGIEDRQTRNFLDRLVEAWNQRTDGQNRFVTADELPQMTGDIISQSISGGVTGGASGTTKGTIGTAIDNLAASIRKSILYQTLQENIPLTDLQSVRTAGTDSGAGLTTEITTRSSKDDALAAAINRIWAYVGGSTAVITDGSLAAVTPSTATADKWTTVIAAVTDPNTGLVNSSSIKQDLNTYANNANSTFNAIYSVRAQVAYGGTVVMGGFGLSATSGAGSSQGATITAGFAANAFFIAAPASGNDPVGDMTVRNNYPFIVTTTPTTINGVTYPAGVYLKSVAIGDATIDVAKITNVLMSDNFVTGTAGWFLRRSDGFFECNNIYARGNIKATSLDVGIVNATNIVANTITAAQILGGALVKVYPAFTSTGTTCSTGSIVVPSGALGVSITFDPGYSNTSGSGKDSPGGQLPNVGYWSESLTGASSHSQNFFLPTPTPGTYNLTCTRVLTGYNTTAMTMLVTVYNK